MSAVAAATASPAALSTDDLPPSQQPVSSTVKLVLSYFIASRDPDAFQMILDTQRFTSEIIEDTTVEVAVPYGDWIVLPTYCQKPAPAEGIAARVMTVVLKYVITGRNHSSPVIVVNSETFTVPVTGETLIDIPIPSYAYSFMSQPTSYPTQSS